MDALALEKQATQLRNTGKGVEAVKLYEQARDAYAAAGDLTKAAGCQHMIGVGYKIENDLPRALAAYKQATAGYQKAGDALGAGRVERDIGVMFEYHDRFAEAEEHLQKSKALLEALPDDQKTAQSADESVSRNAELGITLAKIGLLRVRTGRFDQGEAPIMEGLMLIRGVGHPFYEMTSLMHLGELYLSSNPGRALANLQAALGLLYEYNMQAIHTRRLAQIWGLMARGYLALGNRAAAMHFARKATEVIGGLSPTAQQPLKKDIKFDELARQLELP